VELSLSEEFFALTDCRFAELSINAAGIVNELDQVGPGIFGGIEGFAWSTVVFIREVFCESRPRPTEAESPSFEGRRFVGEAGEIFARFHDSNRLSY